jgi:hypothetical protein
MMILRQACEALGVGYRTLEKYMTRLSITPARHPVDWRFYVLDDEQLAQLREALAQRPGSANGAVRGVRGQELAEHAPVAPVMPASPDSPLRPSQRQSGRAPGSVLDLEPLPGDWIAYNTGFCRDHGELDPRSFARSGFPEPHERAEGWRGHGKHPQRVSKAYDRDQHIQAARMAARRWPHKFKACDACLPFLMVAGEA